MLGEAAKEVFATRLRALAEPAEDLRGTPLKTLVTVESGISTAFYWDFVEFYQGFNGISRGLMLRPIGSMYGIYAHIKGVY